MYQNIDDSTRLILENVPMGLVIHGEDGGVLFSNSRAQNLLGLSEAQLSGKHDIDTKWHIVDGELNDLANADYPAPRVIESLQPLNHVEMGIVSDDSDDIAWVEVNAIPVFNADDKLAAVVVSMQDINDRKKTELSLSQSEKKFNALFGAMTEMVVLHELAFDDAGKPVNYRIVDCNRAFSEITGIQKVDAVGKLATEVYQTAEAPYLDEFQKVAISQEPYEYTTYYPPMDKHFMISVVSPGKNQFATVTTDVTEMKQIEDVLSSKNKELENYLFVASHDLRSPMVNIQGFSQRLKKQTQALKDAFAESEMVADADNKIDTLLNKDVNKTLDFIFTNVAKMDGLINGLLQISRTGRVRMNIQEIDMNKLFEKIISAFNFQLEECDAQVNIGSLPTCFGDSQLLNQLFSNLIDNAIKYRDPGRPLVITVDAQSAFSKVVYRISDSGIGIPEHHLEKIWNVFFRVKEHPDILGDGLGLSISKRIVDKHKGRISVTSIPGERTVFSVELRKSKFSE